MMNEPYEAALNLAMNDLDEMLPQLEKMRERMVALKLMVKGAATILNKYDDIDDKYKFIPIRIPDRVRMPNRPNMPPRRT
jgi:hypothetical protein